MNEKDLECLINKVEKFKFFEKTKRKKSKTSEKGKNDAQQIIFKIPCRRRTRSKSQIFGENDEVLPNGEFDSSKEDLNSVEISPIKSFTENIIMTTANTVDQAYVGINVEKNDSILDSCVVENNAEQYSISKTNGVQNTFADLVTATENSEQILDKPRNNGGPQINLNNTKHEEDKSKTRLENLDTITNSSEQQKIATLTSHEEDENYIRLENSIMKCPDQNLEKNKNDDVLHINVSRSNSGLEKLAETSNKAKRKRKSRLEMLKDLDVADKLTLDDEKKSKRTIKPRNVCLKNNVIKQDNSYLFLTNNVNDLNQSKPSKIFRKSNTLTNKKDKRKTKITQKTRSRKKSEISEQSLNETLNVDNAKKTNKSRPKISKKQKTQSKTENKISKSKNLEKVVKVNVAKSAQVNSYVRLKKITKEQIKKSSSRKIPKKRLDEVLQMIEDDDHPMWEDRNLSCNPCIHHHWEPRCIMTSDQNLKVKYARQFLLRRDWVNLSKILCLSNSDVKKYFPLLSKYAALLLAHTDEEQFKKFLQFLTSINDGNAVLKKCTKL